MKLLYVTKNLPFGPDEAFIYEELRDHRANGCSLTVVPVRGGEVVHEEGRRLLSITLAKSLLAPSVLVDAVIAGVRAPGRTMALLRDVVRDSGWRLLLRNLAVFPKGLWLGLEAARRDIDHIHAHWIAVPATMAMIAARWADIPFSITAHRYDIAQGNLIPAKARYAQFIRTIDRPGSSELETQSLQPGWTTELLYMGVSLPERPVDLRPGLLDPLRILIGARFIEKKGHATLIDAIAEARRNGVNVSADLFGEGPLEHSIRDQVGRLGLTDAVRFTGVASHDQLLTHLRSGRYDAAVLPSVTAGDGDKEGIPVFLMEAMAAGLPVVATPNGGISELVGPEDGLLVAECDVAALCDAFCVIARDEQLRRRLSRNARTRIAESFDCVRNGARLRTLLRGH